MTMLLAFIFVLGVLVFFHESGHFLTAKWVGVRVKTFSLGFPPKILGRKWGDTEYVIGLLPIGGYVKMAGDNPAESSGDPGEFLSRSKWERLAILFAGPFANLVLAMGILTILFMVGLERPAGIDDPPVIHYVVKNSPAERAGLLPGDQVLAIDGAVTETWSDVLDHVLVSANETITVTALRNGQRIETSLEVAARKEDGAGIAGFLPALQPEVGEVSAGSPAEKAGIQPGDVITKVGGKPILHVEQIITEIRSGDGSEVELEVLRGEESRVFRVAPRQESGNWLIGVQFRPPPTTIERYGNPVLAIGAASKEVARFTKMTFVILGKLLTGRTSMKQMSGPIGIAQVAGETAREGPIVYFWFMAVLSVNIAILNLLPVPLLDGGHMAIIAVEGLAGRDFSLQMKERILQVGFVMLLLLMVTVIYVDLSKIESIGKYLPW
ncbi:MAG TPA: RIP metalloprotease RseP [Vicinamibacteria bacterium]